MNYTGDFEADVRGCQEELQSLQACQRLAETMQKKLQQVTDRWEGLSLQSMWTV